MTTPYMGGDDTYSEVRRAMDDSRQDRHERHGDGSRWPEWTQTAIGVLVLVATILTFYFRMDTRISLLEQKLDFIISQQAREMKR